MVLGGVHSRLVNHTVTDEWTKNQTLVHELGHQKQQEQGIDVNQQNNSKALVEYHKIVCNENVLTHTEDQEAKPRVYYSERGAGTFSSGAKERMAAADWPYQADTWDLLLRHVDTLANDNEKRLLREIRWVLDSEENPERYSRKTGNKFSKRDTIEAALAGLYFTGTYPNPVVQPGHEPGKRRGQDSNLRRWVAPDREAPVPDKPLRAPLHDSGPVSRAVHKEYFGIPC